MRVAVIGAGISGLVAARELCRGHEVTVFEAADRLGGHTHTVPVRSNGSDWKVDTGFIVFNEPNYPGFVRLMDELGIRSRPTSMSFSVRSERSGVEYGGSSLNGLFAQRLNAVRPSFLRMVGDILRFNKEAGRVLEDSLDQETTVEDYALREGFSRAFVEDHLLPLGASLWSCSRGTFARFPVRFFVAFLSNHGMLQVKGRPQWRTIVGGSSAYIEPLVRPFSDRIRLSSPVTGINRSGVGVHVTLTGGERLGFDHVVLACHSDQALQMLEDPTAPEREILGSIRYQPNDVVLHTDTRVLPKRRRAWASWNYLVSDDDRASATITYNMNILQGLASKEVFCVTLNETDRIAPERVIRRMTYSHPIFSMKAEWARGRREELVCSNRTSFCGAYWGNGFHEDGVRSAHEVARALEGSLVP